MSNDLEVYTMAYCDDCREPFDTALLSSFAGHYYCDGCLDHAKRERAEVAERALTKIEEIRYIVERGLHEVNYAITHCDTTGMANALHSGRKVTLDAIKAVLDQ